MLKLTRKTHNDTHNLRKFRVKILIGKHHALLRLDTETSSVATTADGTTVDSDGSQEIGDAYESGGVPVAATTAGEDDSRIVMDGLGVSMAPGQDCRHSKLHPRQWYKFHHSIWWHSSQHSHQRYDQQFQRSRHIQATTLSSKGRSTGLPRCQHRILRPGRMSWCKVHDMVRWSDGISDRFRILVILRE